LRPFVLSRQPIRCRLRALRLLAQMPVTTLRRIDPCQCQAAPGLIEVNGNGGEFA
jgi:hypothetical protein